jgi:hypothetical protein
MIAALWFAMQVVGVPTPDAPPAIQPATENAAPETRATEPKVVCRIESVTGSRARKQKVCKTEAYNKSGEEAQRVFQDFQNKASAGGPMGVKPGGG